MAGALLNRLLNLKVAKEQKGVASEPHNNSEVWSFPFRKPYVHGHLTSR
jgi:hypothetical protein